MQTRRGLLLRTPALSLLALPTPVFGRDRVVDIRSHGAIGGLKQPPVTATIVTVAVPYVASVSGFTQLVIAKESPTR